MKRIFALFLILCVLCAPAWAEKTWDVKTVPELSDAINHAEEGDVINVTAGKYDINLPLPIRKSVTVKGADRATTIMNGGGNNIIFEVYDDGVTVDLSGLTFQNSGCGLSVGYIKDDKTPVACTVTVEDCTFRDNSATSGAAIILKKGSTAMVKHCDFTENSSTTAGGAISVGGTLSLEECDFTKNSVTKGVGGGGIEVGNDAKLTAWNCTFKDNVAEEGSGGAIYTSQNLAMTLDGCSFTGNNCNSQGGALYLGPASVGEGVILTNCDFTENKVAGSSGTTSGGAIYVHNGNMTARNCTFANNEIDGGGKGGAIYQDAGMTLVNCVFTGNNAGDKTSGKGGAIYININGGQNKIVHCSFVNNLAQEGMELSVLSKTDMVNSVIYNKDSDDSKWAVCTGVENWQSPEAKLKLDSCAVANDVLNHKGVDNVDCKTISGWAPETVTFTRENGHEATVVQSAGIILGGGAALTGKVLSSVASTYGVDEEFIKADMTGRKRDASAPELGAVSSGKMSPTEPPVIVSFDVEGLKDGGTMIVGRTYTAKATATGEEITWSVLASDALTCTDPDPSVGNSTTFTVTPKPNTDGSAATIILTASNTKGSRKRSLTFSVQTAKEAASSDVTQLIDGETKEKVEKVIGNTFGAYPVMTMQEVSKYISGGGYVQEGIVPDTDVLAALTSGGASLEATLPAFKLTGLSTPVVLVLRVVGLTVSDRTPHFYKMRGAQVEGKAATRLASGVDTSEDKEARFLDDDTIVTTVTSTDLYVAALYTNGSYAPVVTTTPASPTSSHGGGGCDAGLSGLAVLLLAVPLFRRGKR